MSTDRIPASCRKSAIKTMFLGHNFPRASWTVNHKMSPELPA